MDKELIEKYRSQMLDTYRSRPASAPIQTEQTPITLPKQTPPESFVQNDDSAGKLIAIVTAVRGLYPVKNAKVTVFTGTPENKNIISTDFTDQSGRTNEFILPAPSRQLSQQSGSEILPYSMYNMLVEAEGYVDTIHLNIPVFSGVVSLQQSDMLLLETAGVDKSPIIFNEEQQFDL